MLASEQHAVHVFSRTACTGSPYATAKSQLVTLRRTLLPQSLEWTVLSCHTCFHFGGKHWTLSVGGAPSSSCIPGLLLGLPYLWVSHCITEHHNRCIVHAHLQIAPEDTAAVQPWLAWAEAYARFFFRCLRRWVQERPAAAAAALDQARSADALPCVRLLCDGYFFKSLAEVRGASNPKPQF